MTIIRGPAGLVRRLTAPALTGVVLVVTAWRADDYTVTVLSRALAVGLLAVSVAVLAGWAGLDSLGQVAPYAVGAYTAADLARAGVDVGVAQLAAASLAAGVFAGVTGLVLVHARGVTFLLVSLVVGTVTATAAGRLVWLTGGANGLAGIPPIRPWWGTPVLDSDRAVFGYVLATAVALMAVTGWLLRSPAGLLLAGCAQAETRMRAGGHPVGRYLYTAILATGALAGAAGALTVTATGYISPADAGFDTAVLVLLAVAIGGASLPGAVLGAALIVGARNLLPDSWQGHAPLLLGVGFLAAFHLRHGTWPRRVLTGRGQPS
jgi:branched-chain amino acid transport system permease protein